MAVTREDEGGRVKVLHLSPRCVGDGGDRVILGAVDPIRSSARVSIRSTENDGMGETYKSIK